MCVWIPYFLLLYVFHLKDKTCFYFQKTIFRKWFGVVHLFLFYLKKKILNVTLIKKISMGKTESRFRGQVAYWKCIVTS